MRCCKNELSDHNLLRIICDPALVIEMQKICRNRLFNSPRFRPVIGDLYSNAIQYAVDN